MPENRARDWILRYSDIVGFFIFINHYWSIPQIGIIHIYYFCKDFSSCFLWLYLKPYFKWVKDGYMLLDLDCFCLLPWISETNNDMYIINYILPMHFDIYFGMLQLQYCFCQTRTKNSVLHALYRLLCFHLRFFTNVLLTEILGFYMLSICIFYWQTISVITSVSSTRNLHHQKQV